jgi:tetratricopeptide (TPR) repeat protein
MSKHVKWLSILIAGWMLGWHSHRHWSSQDVSPPAELQPGSGLPGNAGKNSAQVGQDNGHVSDRPDSAEKSVFEEFLITGQYQNAIQLFNSQDSQASREQYRTTLIQYLNTLLRVKDYLHAGQILSAYLNEEYRDVDVLLLRARLYWLQGRHRQAIETLYDAKSYEYRTPHIALITEQIRTYVADYDRRLGWRCMNIWYRWNRTTHPISLRWHGRSLARTGLMKRVNRCFLSSQTLSYRMRRGNC